MLFENVKRKGDLCMYPVYNSSTIGGSLEGVSVAAEMHADVLNVKEYCFIMLFVLIAYRLT